MQEETYNSSNNARNIWRSNPIQIIIYIWKTLEFHNIVIVVRFAFRDSNKYYPQALLNEYLHKLAAIRTNRFAE